MSATTPEATPSADSSPETPIELVPAVEPFGSVGPLTVDPEPPPLDLDDPSLYLNRELAQIEFNARVLAQSRDPDVPLLERLRFLTITSTNMDEFYEVRVGGVKQRIAADSFKSGPDGLSPAEVMQRISERAHELVGEQYRVLNEELLPALAAEGIRVLRRSVWTDAQREWIATYFREQVAPLLSPVALDPAHPFPSIINKALCFVVALGGEDAYGRTAPVAILQLPRVLPRVLQLPESVAGPCDFVLISSVIHAQVADLFPGMQLRSCHQFRITRDSDLWVDEEEMDDLLDALKGELPGRRYGDAVRLEVADNCPPETAKVLLKRVGLEDDALFTVNGPVNMHRLSHLIDALERPELKWSPFTPGAPLRRDAQRSVFEIVRDRDILMHHPFESFNPVIELLHAAARDPDVLAIKQTLYRTGGDSPVIAELVEAARNGKEVTVIVELMARFDEAANIEGAMRLRDAGANVVYGIVGYKCHAKMLMVVRREGGKLRRYVHLGTGNYHHRTAKLYTDFGFMTSDPTIGADVHVVFMQLTSVGHAQPLAALLQSPFSLRTEVERLIGFEAEEARAGRPARIVARMNSLSEPSVIRALYEASRAGVQIDLIVRGVCCLRPGVPGLSETITVRSVVGRFLEHSRAFWFHHAGADRVYLASADWMPRNLRRRVEVAFPVTDPTLKQRAITEGLTAYLDDNRQAWRMLPDGSYEPLRPAEGEEVRAAQAVLLAELSEVGRSATALNPPGRRLADLRRKSGKRKKKKKKS